MSTHVNSRRITIFRAPNFALRAQNDESVIDYFSQASEGFGAFWDGAVIGSGLTPAEQDLLMPYILGIGTAERDFRKQVRDFFVGLTVKVPPTTGLDLEIGLSENNEHPVSATNLPINVTDYIKYRFAMAHPWVAESKDEADHNQLKKFYIFDAEQQLREESKKIVVQDKADSIYLQIKDNIGKVRMLLTIIGKDEREYNVRNGEQLMRKHLREYVATEAFKFIEIYEDQKFETRYWLRAMVKAGVVKSIGTSYVISENNTLLGRSEAEALLYLEDPANSDTVAFLKGNTQEVLRKPRTAKKATA